MDQRQAEQLASLAPALAPVAKTVTTYYMNKRRMEQEKEMELELVEKRAEAAAEANREPAPRPAPQPSPESDSGGDEAESESEAESDAAGIGHAIAIERLKDETECKTCKHLLDGIKDLPADEQGIAISQYGRVKGKIEDQTSLEETKEALRDSPMLMRVLREQFNIPEEEVEA